MLSFQGVVSSCLIVMYCHPCFHHVLFALAMGDDEIRLLTIHIIIYSTYVFYLLTAKRETKDACPKNKMISRISDVSGGILPDGSKLGLSPYAPS